MLGGLGCQIDIGTFQNDMTSFREKNDVLTLLIHLGYLAYDETTGTAYIPNDEVRAEFFRAVKGSGWHEVVDAVRASEDRLIRELPTKRFCRYGLSPQKAQRQACHIGGAEMESFCGRGDPLDQNAAICESAGGL